MLDDVISLNISKEESCVELTLKLDRGKNKVWKYQNFSQMELVNFYLKLQLLLKKYEV